MMKNLIFFIIKHDTFLENKEKSFFRTNKLLNNCLERPYLAGILLINQNALSGIM